MNWIECFSVLWRFPSVFSFLIVIPTLFQIYLDLDLSFRTFVFTFETLKVHWRENRSSVEVLKICNMLKNHLRSLLKMQIRGFTRKDRCPRMCVLSKRCKVISGQVMEHAWRSSSRVLNPLRIKIHHVPQSSALTQPLCGCLLMVLKEKYGIRVHMFY